MARSPSIVPNIDHEVVLVLDDLGSSGRVWRESGENDSDRSDVIDAIVTGQYASPVRVVAFNTHEGWSRDVTEEIAREITDAALRQAERLSKSAQAFVEWATADDVPAELRAEV